MDRSIGLSKFPKRIRNKIQIHLNKIACELNSSKLNGTEISTFPRCELIKKLEYTNLYLLK